MCADAYYTGSLKVNPAKGLVLQLVFRASAQNNHRENPSIHRDLNTVTDKKLSDFFYREQSLDNMLRAITSKFEKNAPNPKTPKPQLLLE